ncbi:membrane protein of unknown function [Candidatus Promineifilum breve]|uniref:Uncharacterized protein n=1 Tax=Candidatus Promineifilum breve TaxID=1806508 RepID=A0A160T3C1_9CHLR|nr:hypothetical protein [Candidatus Promineifilum breve]CUS03115.2 membrane protein of unknown function [Candidatus Promineifilum breve]
MSDEMTPISIQSEETSPPAGARPGLGTVLLVILLTTAPLLGLLYLGAQFLNLPFTPFDLYDWPIRAGFAPWIGLIDALNGAQTADGGNIAQSAPLVRWLLSLAVFLLIAFAFGLAFYAFVLRRGRVPDLIDGLAIGALFAAPMILVSLTTSPSTLPAALIIVWLGALFVVWGVVLSYAFGRLMDGAAISGGEPAAGGIDRRQFLLQFGAGAAAITAISAAAGATLAPGRQAAELQRTLPMISPDFLAAQQELFGNFRRFVIVRGGAESAADSNVLALGAEYPDRNYVSIWLGGRSPIVIYENLETALAAYSTEEAEAGIFWLDG